MKHEWGERAGMASLLLSYSPARRLACPGWWWIDTEVCDGEAVFFA